MSIPGDFLLLLQLLSTSQKTRLWHSSPYNRLAAASFRRAPIASSVACWASLTSLWYSSRCSSVLEEDATLPGRMPESFFSK